MVRTYLHVLIGGALCLWMGLTGPVATAQEADTNATPAYTFLRGANIPVRGKDDTEFSENNVTVPVEMYRDEVSGSVLMVTETGSIATLKPREAFQVKLLGLDEQLIAVRYMPRSGYAWVLENMQWVQVAEPPGSPLFMGSYDVQMVETDGVVWYVRSDSSTGRVWVLSREDEDQPPEWVYTSDPDLDGPESIASGVE